MIDNHGSALTARPRTRNSSQFTSLCGSARQARAMSTQNAAGISGAIAMLLNTIGALENSAAHAKAVAPVDPVRRNTQRQVSIAMTVVSATMSQTARSAAAAPVMPLERATRV